MKLAIGKLVSAPKGLSLLVASSHRSLGFEHWFNDSSMSSARNSPSRIWLWEDWGVGKQASHNLTGHCED